jgi:isopenicillin N synthase-like dioxygenase
MCGREMMTASLELIELIAIGLGLPPSYYKDLFVPRSLSTLRPQHYPLRDFQAPPIAIEDGQVVICETHADNVFITLLATYHFTGLQVLLSDGSWLNVAPRPGSLVLNLGTFFAESTSWQLKATKHRVIETREDRYSLPFFLEPGYKAMIPRSLPGSSDSPMEYVQYGPFLIERSRKFAEFGDILELAKEVLNEK